MASNHTFTLFSLAAMLATGCGSARQESGSCYTHDNNGGESCISYYGTLVNPTLNESTCDLTGGEWSNEDCPDGFWGWCDIESSPDSGMLTYEYGDSNYAQLTCEIMGAWDVYEKVTWHEVTTGQE